MKRSLIALVSLQACAVASLAVAASRSRQDDDVMVLTPSPGEQTNEIKLSLVNDERFVVGHIPPIVTREMLAAQADKRPIHKNDRKPRLIKDSDLNPVSIIKRQGLGGGSQCLPVLRLTAHDRHLRSTQAT